jgi:putative transcriptional regulator
MKVIINQILTNKCKTVYWLSKELHCDFQSLQRLINNQSTKISFNLLEDICIVLNCTPSDVLKIDNFSHKKRATDR